MAASKTEYRHTGTHPEDLHDGRVIGVGEYVKLTEKELDEPHNARLVNEGIFIPVDKAAEGGES